MPKECRTEGIKHIETLFANGGHITAEAGKGFCSAKGAESACDFLFDFHHASVTFSQIVVKGNTEIMDEG